MKLLALACLFIAFGITIAFIVEMIRVGLLGGKVK